MRRATLAAVLVYESWDYYHLVVRRHGWIEHEVIVAVEVPARAS